MRWCGSLKSDKQGELAMKRLNKQLAKSVFVKYLFLLLFLVFSVTGLKAMAATGVNGNATEGGDCDANAIIYCGVNQSSLPGRYASLDAKGKAAFAHAGVDPSKLGHTVVGLVTRDNKVIVGGQVVATNVYTYGRQYMSGSTQISGGAYMRHPSVSFRSASISAYVYMEGKEFKWAVISTCGNPVKGTPTTPNNPHGQITKTASKSVVTRGEQFGYTITFRNVGNVALKNVLIADILPVGIVPAPGQSGFTYNPATRKITFAAVGTMNPGASVTKTFKVNTSASTPLGALKNVACVTTNYNQNLPICDDAIVVIKVPGVPSLSIQKKVSVNRPVNVGEVFTYTIIVTNTGPKKITNARITDTLPAGIIAVDHPNDRTVSFVIPELKIGESKTKSFQAKATSDAVTDSNLVNVACVVSNETPTKKCDDVPVKVVPKTPVFACNSLAVATVDDDGQLPFNVTFTGNGTASNGAVIEGYIWNFGDGQSTQTTANTANHGYNATGSYTATLQIKTNKGTTPVSANCSVKVEVPENPPTPIYTCDALAVTKQGEMTYRFAVNYTAKDGATLKNFVYNFGDGNSSTTTNNPVDHTYTQPGTYNTTVSVVVTVNGEEKTVTSDACKKSITITQTQEPVYTCDSLGVTHLGDLKYRFQVETTVLNGATVSGYVVDFGDSQDEHSTTSNVFEHTYAQPGTYKVQATVLFMVDGEQKTVTGESCAATVNTEKPDNCTVPGKEHLPKDSPLCKPDVPPTPKTPETPATTQTVLPDTGPGEVLGIFASIAVAASVAYRFVWLRQYF